MICLKDFIESCDAQVYKITVKHSIFIAVHYLNNPFYRKDT